EVEARATELLEKIAAMGGAVRAIEEGWMQSQIEESAYQEARRQTTGESVVVGVNRFAVDEQDPIPVLAVDPVLEAEQKERLAAWRSGRDTDATERSLQRLEAAARGDDNLLYPMKEALAAGATVGEVSDTLRSVFGVHRP